MGASVAHEVAAGDVALDWRRKAACRRSDPELYFPDSGTEETGGQIAAAKQVCRRCPVRVTCLSWALASGPEAGIWGGTTEQERRALRRHLGASGLGPG